MDVGLLPRLKTNALLSDGVAEPICKRPEITDVPIPTLPPSVMSTRLPVAEYVESPPVAKTIPPLAAIANPPLFHSTLSAMRFQFEICHLY